MCKNITTLLILILIIPTLALSQVNKKPVSKVSFDFMDADIRNVLRVLTDISGKNIVISDDVKGKITIKLDNVTWDEAMDIVIKNNDLAKVEEENIIRVVSSKKFLDEKDKDRKERLEFLKEKEMKQKLEEDFVQETVFLNYVDVSEVEKVIRGDESRKIKGLLSPNGTATPVKWTNSLIIKDTRENIDEVKKRIREHDIKPSQVQIEARIVQAGSEFIRDLGVQWGARYKSTIGGKDVELTGGRTATSSSGTSSSYTPTAGQAGQRPDGYNFPYNVNLPAAVGQGSGGVLGIFIGSAADSLNLDVQLSALESDGKLKIISHPKVVTSDNKPAKIHQGKQIPYQTVSQSGTQTQFADAVLGLEVTPQVTKDGNIRLKIKVTKDSADFNNLTVSGPTIDKREAVTEVIIKDGETAVIGGIYETQDNVTDSSVPYLSKIPLLGWMFKRDYKKLQKTELVLFITPLILKNLYAEGDK
ncbi:MAG: type IV pilus secretin PilQ [Syntrophorhabdus sp.]|jgi:type IV pilus assembly protein PilQ|nr:type IV pilus secretin PilQ [Bacteroidales bacterium]MDI9559937.1 type IV pilus secretin PilQ [Pseudomonadota bacterium]NMC93419.1 type IV pilus secretin PilQ [Syntrophorhabdus sp.]OQB77798.1 MAG: Type IV pilus biogenesis and competence protein PilQ precursor [Deltaproteobacteria bacterium ADurb.Bin135]HPW35588.1 type IV pilus secretin PilQ [Syntrophorhabdus sp.]